jgi:hypothetical protein
MPVAEVRAMPVDQYRAFVEYMNATNDRMGDLFG